MRRFHAIEGLRAWLAWTVVLSHISQTLGMPLQGGQWWRVEEAGTTAVLVFIAISGFVITGLVTAKRETWLRYIIRRAFRIFPAYWIAFALALIGLPLAIAALRHQPWSCEPGFGYDAILSDWSRAMHDHFAAQLFLHLTLLQGLVPDSVWPATGTAVLGPSWSLTLEWQFYLIAPALIWLLRDERWRVQTAAAVGVLALASTRDVFGHFSMPTFLPGAGYVFCWDRQPAGVQQPRARSCQRCSTGRGYRTSHRLS